MAEQFKTVYSAAVDGRAQNPRYVQNQLKKLYEALSEAHSSIKRAIRRDTEHLPAEIEAEYLLTLASVREQYSSIDIDKALEQEYSLANGKNNPEKSLPYGLIYLVPSQYNPFYSTIVPLSLAIATGNCVVLELKQTLSEINALLRHLLSSTLDIETFAVVDSKPDLSDIFSRDNVQIQDFSNLQTPSQDHSIPPRTVAVVDRSSNIVDAAREIVRARFSFRGSSPHAPDAVLVNEFALKDFCNAVVQNATALVAAHVDGMTNGNASKPYRKQARSPSKKPISEDGASTLLSTSQGTVMIIRESSSKLLSTKITEPLLLIHPVSSLDDAIDLIGRSSDKPLLATYLFAAPPAAKYLSQFINSRLSCTNKIPAELLIGPATPESFTPTIESRFSKQMFQVSRPEYISFPSNSAMLGDLFDHGESKAWREFRTKLQTHLAPTGQPEGKAIGFFEQGLLTGVSILGISAVASIALLGLYGVPIVIRRLR